MTTHIAILRGINVSGHHTVKMAALRALFAKSGFKNIKTYIQSGNVIFDSSAATNGLAAKIENQIRDTFGIEVPVLTKTTAELADIVQRNPFVKDTAIDQTKLHVTFLSGTPAKDALKLLQRLAAGAEQVRIAGRAVYLYLPAGYGTTKLTNTAIERKLSCRATTRNWKTTNTLLKMAASFDP